MKKEKHYTIDDIEAKIAEFRHYLKEAIFQYPSDSTNYREIDRLLNNTALTAFDDEEEYAIFHKVEGGVEEVIHRWKANER